MKKGGAYLRSHGMDEKLLSTNLSAAGLGFFARLAVLVDLLTLPLPHDTVPPIPNAAPTSWKHFAYGTRTHAGSPQNKPTTDGRH